MQASIFWRRTVCNPKVLSLLSLMQWSVLLMQPLSGAFFCLGNYQTLALWESHRAVLCFNFAEIICKTSLKSNYTYVQNAFGSLVHWTITV